MANANNKVDETPTSLRLCVLNREPGESLGFTITLLKSYSGHIVGGLAPGGIGESSGLWNGDRILEVNGCFVDDVPHDEVTKKINISGTQVSLLVLNKEEYKEFKSKGHDLKKLSKKSENLKPPRLLHIIKDPKSGLGISFTAVEGKNNHYAVNVVPGGGAEKAGVDQKDRVVWMNGVPAGDLSSSVISWMLKKCSSQMTVLVIDPESEEYYNSWGIPILPAMATEHNLPFISRRLHLVRGEDLYGFILRHEHLPSGRNAHILLEFDDESPADKAGMHCGDRLLEVNGASVESLTHLEIVEKVRKAEQELTLTTISPQGLDFYTMLGISPLLFCEDVIEKQYGSVPEEKESSLPTILIHEKPSSIRSRLCSVQRASLGFGFDLSGDMPGSGIYISQVVDGGPGHEAGLKKGDEVLEINGQNVEEKSLEEVVQLIEESGSNVSVLVIQKTDTNDSDSDNVSIEEEDKL